MPFTSPAATQRSCPWQNNLVKAVPKACLKEANWTKVVQLKHVDPSFTNTSPICHGIQWPQEAAFHASDRRERSESLEKKYNSPKTFTFYSYPPQSCHDIILLSLNVSWLRLEPDTLFVFTQGHPSKWLPYTRWCWDLPGGARIPGSSLWSGN